MNEKAKFLAKRIKDVLNNPANLYNRNDATKNYVRLAKRYADRVQESGNKDAADMIYAELAEFYALVRV